MAERDIRVTYRDGRFVPHDPVEYEDGKSFTITVHEEADEVEEAEAARRRAEVVRKSFGAWKGLVDTDKLKQCLRESRELPTEPAPKL